MKENEVENDMHSTTHNPNNMGEGFDFNALYVLSALTYAISV